MFASNGERMPPWGAGEGLSLRPIRREPARAEKRAQQRQPALVAHATAHAVHEGPVVDFIEARRDIGFKDPPVVPGRGPEVVNRGDGVLRPPPRAEPVAARQEVGFENRLQPQLHGGWVGAVGRGRNPQAAQLPH